MITRQEITLETHTLTLIDRGQFADNRYVIDVYDHDDFQHTEILMTLETLRELGRAVHNVAAAPLNGN